MSKSTKIVLSTICLAVVIISVFMWYLEVSYRYDYLWYNRVDIKRASDCLKLFIQQNNGKFPASKKELIEKGFMKYDLEDPNNYSLRVHPEDFLVDPRSRWINIEDAGALYINYGFKIESVKKVDDKLFSKADGSQVLLVDYKFFKENWKNEILRKYCEHYTRELYKEMLRLKKK